MTECSFSSFLAGYQNKLRDMPHQLSTILHARSRVVGTISAMLYRSPCSDVKPILPEGVGRAHQQLRTLQSSITHGRQANEVFTPGSPCAASCSFLCWPPLALPKQIQTEHKSLIAPQVWNLRPSTLMLKDSIFAPRFFCDFWRCTHALHRRRRHPSSEKQTHTERKGQPINEHPPRATSAKEKAEGVQARRKIWVKNGPQAGAVANRDLRCRWSLR